MIGQCLFFDIKTTEYTRKVIGVFDFSGVEFLIFSWVSSSAFSLISKVHKLS